MLDQNKKHKGDIMFSLNTGGLFAFIYPDGAIINNTNFFYATYFGFALLIVTVSYLLGSINSAIIVSRVLYHDDIRKHGSGNAGLTNTLRTYGGRAAVLTLLGDVLKTVIAILFAAVLFGFNYVKGVSTGEGFCYVAGLFSVLGHIFPIYYKFKGGKGVLSTAAMVLMLAPGVFLLLLILFVLIVFMSRYVSLGSICAAGLFPIVLHSYFLVILKAQPFGLITLTSVILAVMIIVFHKENIKRIQSRTERKLSFKKNGDAQ